MEALQLKLTASIVRQISRIERRIGKLENIEALPAAQLTNFGEEISAEFVRSARRIDSSGTISEELFLQFARIQARFPTTFEELERLVAPLFKEEPKRVYRDTGQSLLSGEAHGGEVIFAGVQPYLISKRLRELLNWVSSELHFRGSHPLLVGAVFHLVFLQSLPFRQGNQTLAFLLLRTFLLQEEDPLIRFIPFASVIEADPRSYYAALRQGEKTVYSNWSSLNVWMEYFLHVIERALHETHSRIELRFSESSLSSLQKQILEIVRACGSTSREHVVEATGTSESTVKYNLRILSERGYLRRSGGGRGTNYRMT